MSSTGFMAASRILAAPFSFVCTLVLFLTLAVAPCGAPLAAQPGSFTLLKTGMLDMGGDGLATPGDTIAYTFTIDNSNQPGECSDIEDLVLTDTLLGTIDCGPTPVTVPPGQLQCFASYPITQDDIDAGEVSNQATASGVVGCEVREQVTDDHQELIEQVATIELAKAGTLDMGGDGIATPGDEITYVLTVTNSGNVTLTNVTLTDSVLAAFTCDGGVHPIPTLAPAGSESCGGTYAITQVDIDAGFKENTADVTAEEPGEQQPPPTATRLATNQVTIQVPIPQQPLIQLTKTGTPDFGADGFADPWDLINYSFQVGNPGNVTLTAVAVSDPLITPVTCPSGNPIPTFAPGASEMCTGSYALTAADIAAGSRANTAQASGMDPMTQPVTAGDADMVPLPAAVPVAAPLGLLILAVPHVPPIALGAAAMAVLIIVAVWERLSLGSGAGEPRLEI